MRAGPGFISLQGPRGLDGGTLPMFPGVVHLTGELDTQTKHDDAIEKAVLDGGAHGDLYVTPTGRLYRLEIVQGTPNLVGVGTVAGPPGTQGAATAVPGAHTPADHHIVSPLKYLPGNYGELASGPSVVIDPWP